MKILYAIQGTGNGHICRAKEIVPYLQKHGELHILVSGVQSEIKLPFKIDYNYHGMSFVFGKRGGIDYLNTYMKSHLKEFMAEVKKLPVEQYDLVISDFEPISAWASYLKGKRCIGLSNQCALKLESTKLDVKEDLVGKFILNNYAPVSEEYGFHFKPKSSNIFTPIIRKELRELKPSNLGHYTVYLPAYSDHRIVKVLGQIEGVEWQVFSKRAKSKKQIGSILIEPINSQGFLKSMASATGVITAAGFGTTTEALFLGKKLLVIPQKQQFEQLCNGLLLREMGVKVIKHLRKRNIPKIENWIENGEVIEVDYPDQTELIVETIVNNEFHSSDNYLDYITHSQFELA